MSITTTQIVSEYGAYYLGDATNMNRLKTQMMAPTNFDKALTAVDSPGSVYQGSYASISDILQPYQKAFTPKGDTTFLPCPNPLFKVKGDASEVPDDIDGKYTAFLRGPGIDRKEWPFVRWWMEQLIIPKYKSNLDKAKYQGVYSAPTPGTPGAVLDSMDGLRAILNYHVSSTGRTPSYSTGTPDTDPLTWYDQLLTWYDDVQAAHPEFIANIKFINMAPELLQRAKRGYKKKYPGSPEYTTIDMADEQYMMLDGAPVALRGLEAMRGSSKIWASVEGNALDLTWIKDNSGIWQLENVDRTVKVYSDDWKGVGFEVPEFVVTNEQTV